MNKSPSKYLNQVISHAAKKNIHIESKSVHFLTKGYTSIVYKAHSNRGKITIHVTQTIAEHARNKVWSAIPSVTAFAIKNGVPTVPTYIAGRLDSTHHFTIEPFISAKTVGNRLITKTSITDRYKKKLTKQATSAIAKAVNRIHEITLSGYGPITITRNSLRGKYPTWEKFLRVESKFWLKSAYAKETSESKSAKEIVKKLIKEIVRMPITKAVLVHGDITNPSNILVEANNIQIIDFEWAIAGDPLWDLVLAPPITRSNYFRTQKYTVVQKKKAERQIRLYTALWLLIGASRQSRNKDVRRVCLLNFHLASDSVLREAP